MLFRYDARVLITMELFKISKARLFRKPESNTINQMAFDIQNKLNNISLSVIRNFLYELRDRNILKKDSIIKINNGNKEITYHLNQKKFISEFKQEFEETAMFEFIDKYVYNILD